MNDFLAMEERVIRAVEEIGPAVLGQRLRRARLREGLSIRDLADRSRVSKTSIVRLEQGRPFQATTLVKVCAGIGMHLDRFLESDEGDEIAAVHRLSDDRWYDLVRFADGPLSDGPLTPEERARIASDASVTPFLIFKVHLAEGRAVATLIEAYHESAPRSHPGEEFVYVLSGAAKIRVGAQTYVLEKGECMSFWSTEEHTYAPAAATEAPARILCVHVSA